MIGRSRDILSASAGFSTQTTAITCWHNTKKNCSENWKGITTIKPTIKNRTCHILNELKIWYGYCDGKDLAWDHLWLEGQLEGQQTWRSAMTCNCCVSNCNNSFRNATNLNYLEFLGALMHQVCVLQSADVESVISRLPTALRKWSRDSRRRPTRLSLNPSPPEWTMESHRCAMVDMHK